MDSTILSGIAGIFDSAMAGVKSVFDWLSKGTLDVTAVAQAKIDLQKVMANLEFSKQQMQIWVEQSLIDMEKATGAKWRTPLILISGIGVVVVCLNNILAYTYIPSAHLISLASPEMVVLVGFFVLLVTGSLDLLMSVFKPTVSKTDPKGDKK